MRIEVFLTNSFPFVEKRITFEWIDEATTVCMHLTKVEYKSTILDC